MDHAFRARVTSVPGRYAKALFLTAQEKKVEESLLSDLKLFREIIKSCPGTMGILAASNAESEKVARFIEHICTNFQNDQLVKSFLSTLSERGRIRLLPQIITLFKNYAAEVQGRIQVHITSAQNLAAPEKQEIEKICLDRARKPVAFSYAIDPELIAGFTARFGSQQIDASVKGYLTRLKCHFKEDAA